MIVTCEKCQTKYKLNDLELDKIKSKGRILKCSNCHHLWLLKYNSNNFKQAFQTHSPFDAELIKQIKNSREESLLLREISTGSKISDYFKYANLLFFIKITFFILLFLAFLTFVVTQKNQLLNTKILKPVVSFFGLTDTKDLKFDKITISATSFILNEPLLLTGYIVNNSSKRKIIPDYRIKFLSKNGQILKILTFKLPKKYLEPNEKSKISNRINLYPKETDKIELEIGNYWEFFFR